MDIKNKIIPLLVFILATVLFSCTNPSEEKAVPEHKNADEISEVKLTEAQYKGAEIAVGKLEERSMSGVIKVSGTFDVPPQNLITISLPYAGIVKRTILLQGLEVKKGEVLVVMEHPEFIQLQQDYLDNKSRLDYMQLELQRQEELQRENVNSAKVYQQAKADYESLKARVSGLSAKLSLINIKTSELEQHGISKQINVVAPISGFITQVNINIGMLVNPNDVICKIVDIGHLHAELTVFEKDVMNLKIGQKVHFQVNNESHTRTASVYLIGKEISPDRTVRVHCHLDKEDKDLLPGMYLTAYIETQAKKSWALPSQAIVTQANKNYIFVAKGKVKEEYVFDMIPVQVGIVETNYSEVLVPEKFDTTSNVVINGAYDLLSKHNMEGEEEEGHSH